MGFNPTFYAGRPKLSEVTIDSDLDMGGRNILRAGRVDSPYMPETWPTEELSWNDGGETEEIPIVEVAQGLSTTETVLETFTTPPSETSKLWQFTYNTFCQTPAYPAIMRIKQGSTILDEVNITGGMQKVTSVRKVVIAPEQTISITAQTTSTGAIPTLYASSTYKCTGLNYGEMVFDLSGKWLALGIDMKGLAATVKIQGVEIPYSDYAKYFPIAPTELSIPGEWDASQIRPIVEVYV